MNIVFLDALTLGDVDFERFKKFGNVKIYQTTKPSETLERVKEADIVVTNKVVIDKHIMDNADIKFIQIAATGMNNVDLEYAKQKGIPVKNVAGYSTNAVIQQTFALVLGLLNKVCYFDSYTRNEYPQSEIFTHIQNWFEISGKRWGIIGLGEIGRGVAKIAKSFGAEVVYYSTSGKNSNPEYKRVELDELLKTSDIISIHAPLNENTKDLLNYEKLSLIKDNAVLVNLGRGGIINEKDLAGILKQKDMFVGLDVFEKEPVNADNPLLKYKDKTLLSPHIAWTSIEARNKLMDGIYKNIEEFAKSGN
ncbi:D-isomer specific 2-hydroxyacid dehydrogenase, NAD-binding [Nautilia profundicola AmH]|uniref:D-isomer specific 2-hydroxyacid dehydrogenase, NAD-binding n=1 Tax=Nautilia profundicola (strain ATCC BAA-1463 / DSM 18972 / AmH) TaxID=598659 RepID=B9L794_NAUPA|nr:D-2-hydroxyacid dehydrogenase [Nautilia profundicola]ACM92647.1 D-isomer specific 2-hydroxyacid dehydrogenase, NAD-binding [Nautilia profundicola AmH]